MNIVFTPREILANIPGLLGYYPHESLVFVTCVKNSENRIVLGPVLRLDINDARHLPDVDQALSVVEPEFVMGFVITSRLSAEQIEDLRDYLSQLSHCGILHLDGCWITTDIATSQRYRALFLGDDAQRWADKDRCWQEGEISQISASRTSQALLECGELPAISRGEAFHYFEATGEQLEDLDVASLYQSALMRAQAIKSDKQQGCDLIKQLRMILMSAWESPADTHYLNNAHLNVVREILSDSFLRDLCLSEFLEQPEATRRVTREVAQLSSGNIRANALCVYAISCCSTPLSPRIPIALASALDDNPDHRLSRLLLAGYQTGELARVYEAVQEGVQQTWESLGFCNDGKTNAAA
ncbi:DUF4192 domain-containing protein [Corynebacterium ulcerans]|uniref:DUF4192 domain-containing protein n=1 Tax=Corynebacterium ulcerans TaxID=65058 RepID=UPI00051F7D31|nr:DUF4192 domain-containing protein [Corynebacterium ulcerans]AIT89334.1 Hypothetical protein Cul210932_1395 [Corynebacterium ulcerans]ALD95110.1 Hypothetical protein Cul131001_1413 [Corynebacterium ulcerans]SQG58956.1 Uncharacterised protein [Corynebacterium ulcerans]